MINGFWTKWQLWPKNVITQIRQSLYNSISTLELPSWLRLSGATCNRVAVRIQWTKLKSVPIQLSLDEVSTSLNIVIFSPNIVTCPLRGVILELSLFILGAGKLFRYSSKEFLPYTNLTLFFTLGIILLFFWMKLHA